MSFGPFKTDSSVIPAESGSIPPESGPIPPESSHSCEIRSHSCGIRSHSCGLLSHSCGLHRSPVSPTGMGGALKSTDSHVAISTGETWYVFVHHCRGIVPMGWPGPGFCPIRWLLFRTHFQMKSGRPWRRGIELAGNMGSFCSPHFLPLAS